MGSLSREEFKRGMQALGTDKLDQLPALLAKARETLKDGPTFALFYQFLFEYVKGTERRTLDVDEAVVLWRMWLLNNDTHRDRRPFHHLAEFIEWLDTEDKDPLTRDLWNQLLVFIFSHDKELSTYDPNDAWPVRIDEFVEWLKKNKMSGPGTSVC